VTRYVEFHLGRIITLSALSELLTEISIDRFQGFVRISEAGEGRFVLSFPRADAADVALLTLIRENPSQLYAERSAGYLGDWVLEVYAAEIGSRLGALVSTEERNSLHSPALIVLPTFADWLLSDERNASCAEDLFARYSGVVPLPLRGIVRFRGR
jgi:hypothetical protein